MIIKRVSKWYGWCLLIGSSMFLICYLPLAPIFSFALARNINPSQYAQLSIAIQILINLALLVFGVGFIGLTRQFNRLLLASLRKNSNWILTFNYFLPIILGKRESRGLYQFQGWIARANYFYSWIRNFLPKSVALLGLFWYLYISIKDFRCNQTSDFLVYRWLTSNFLSAA